MSDFVVMAKPVGSLCNMQCSYCYYLNADNGSAPPHMSDEILETYIRSYMNAVSGKVISFTWHGGEPTLAGLEFFQKAVALQKKYLPAGRECWNNLQTNGLYLDDTWCRFLKENRFDVGVSIDGTRFIHDLYRHDTGGRPTYQRVADTVTRLKKHGIMPDLLCTVTSDTAANGKAVYEALRRFNTGWIQFIPIVRRENGSVTEDSVTPQLYGKFLKDVFREWASHDMGKTNVQLFAETALVLAGGSPDVCWLAETCGTVLIVERDGNVYSCDHFVDRHHLIGNVLENDLGTLAESDAQRSFGNAKKDALVRQCRECPYLKFCGGGCLKDRFANADDGEQGLYYLCDGLRQYYDYAVPLLKKSMELSAQSHSSAEIMRLLFKK